MSGLALLATACGGDDDDTSSPGTSAAGNGTVSGSGGGGSGVEPYDDDELREIIDGLRSENEDLKARLDKLEEAPAPMSCSEGNFDMCIPDGLDLQSAGLTPLAQAVCDQTVKCCTVDELNVELGLAVEDADDCVAAFQSIVNRGISSLALTDFPILADVIPLTESLNRGAIAIDGDAIAACAATLDVDCDPDAVSVTPECGATAAESPCTASKFVVGQLSEGASCSYNNLVSNDINECAAGLVCRPNTNPNIPGVCAPAAQAGDSCASGESCDSAVTDLFCNDSAGVCEEKRAEGEDCDFIDFDSGLTGLKIECADGLKCSYTTKKCVPTCDEGTACSSNADCDASLVCGRNEFEDQGYDVCRAPKALDAECTVAEECASDNCQDADSSLSTPNVCVAARKATGACTDGYECASDVCLDGQCRPACDFNDDPTCPAGQYCDFASGLASEGVCFELIADNAPDDCSPAAPLADANDRCASGFCSGSTCLPRAAADGECPTGESGECPDGQYCDLNSPSIGTNTCTDVVNEGGACTSLECADGLVCFDLTCVDASSRPVGVECASDAQCADGLLCLYNAAVFDAECRTPLAEGATCTRRSGTSASACAAGFYCNVPSGETEGVCAPKKTAGQTCDDRLDTNGFGDTVCVVPGSCQLRGDTYICGGTSVAPSGDPDDPAFLCDGTP